jgi:small conductance mechanosensitive channel
MDFFSGENLTTLGKTILSSAATFLPHALAAILIIVAGVAISRRAARGTARLLQRPGQVDPALRFIAAELVRYGIVAVALVVALSQLGIASTSLLAVIGGAAGLAIGLSLQGTLSNIAAGLMLLWLRPFHIGDYIEVNNVPNLAGSVSRMGLFTCQLEAFDGLFLFVPNSALWNVPLRNYTRNAGRLISLGVTIPESVPVNQARRILLEIANADHRIADSPKPLVFVERCTIDSVLLNFRV